MLNYKLKIGLIPERRYLPGPKRTGMFNSDYADANKEKAFKVIKEQFTDQDTEFFDLDWLNDEGLLIETKDCQQVADYMKEKKVDAIFIINCNFGNEEAAGKVAQLLNLPTLLWGPRDRIIEPDGTRYTDTQCGLFSISKQLKRYNVPYTYIENCDPEEDTFIQGVKKFLSVACMVKNFHHLRILQAGNRVKPFKCVMINELELTERFGIDVVPVNMAEITNRMNAILIDRRITLAEHIKEIRSKFDVSDVSEENLYKLSAFIEMYQDVLKEYQCDLIATECWTSMNVAFGVLPCLAMSILADKGCIVLCETDVHGAITAALLSCAARGRKTTFFGEFTMRHPTNNNAELLWHCGVFASSLKKDGPIRKLCIGYKPDFCVRDGHYTLARFQAERGNYYLLAGEFDTTDGPQTAGTYLWAQFNNLPAVERKLIEGPYMHHQSEVEGSYFDVLKEFAKYVPDLVFDPLENY